MRQIESKASAPGPKNSTTVCLTNHSGIWTSKSQSSIGDVHGARGEMEIAKVLDDGLSAEIAALHDRFETSSIQELGFGRVYARDLLSWGDE